MKPTFKIVLAVAVLALAMSVSFAQGRRQGRSGFGRGGQMNYARLLTRSDVQADLGLNDDQKAKITAMRDAARSQRRNRGADNTATRPSPDEMKARAAEERKQVESILTPDQLTRLGQIQIQLQGDRAIMSPEVQTKLGLTDSQKAKVKSLQETFGSANRSIFEKQRSGEIDRNAAREAMQKNAKVLADELHKVLTPDQAAQLAALGGKPFKAEEQTGGRFGG